MKGHINSTLDERNKQDLEDKDGDHIPDRIDSNYTPDGHITQSDIPQSDIQTVNYWRAIVTEDECSKLDKADFPYDKSRKKLADGRIPIRFKSELKQEYQKIISSSATIKVGGKVGK